MCEAGLRRGPCISCLLILAGGKNWIYLDMAVWRGYLESSINATKSAVG